MVLLQTQEGHPVRCRNHASERTALLSVLEATHRGWLVLLMVTGGQAAFLLEGTREATPCAPQQVHARCNPTAVDLCESSVESFKGTLAADLYDHHCQHLHGHMHR